MPAYWLRVLTPTIVLAEASWIWKAAVLSVPGLTITPPVEPPGLRFMLPVPDWIVVVEVVLVEPKVMVWTAAPVPIWIP